MHVPGKWIEGDTLFNSLGTLILGIGLFVSASLVIYASRYLT
jgi:hypothetical protein